MKKISLFLLTLVFAFFAFAFAEKALRVPVKATPEKVRYVSDEISVNFTSQAGKIKSFVRDGVALTGNSSLDILNSRFKVSLMKEIFPGAFDRGIGTLSGYYIIRFDPSFAIEDVLKAFKANPLVKNAERIPICPIYASYPNDYYFGPEGHPTFPYYQWYHDISSDHDMDSPEGWDFEKGDSTLILAILDSGVRYFHKDLGGPDASYANPENSIYGNVWINWAEKNGTNGVDDDDNGFVDDWVGWDWVNVSPTFPCTGEDYTGPDNDPRDFNGHGTHCAGLASAITNNARGVAGFAGGWGDGTTGTYGNGVKIMCLRIGWSECHPLYGELGYVNMVHAASALYYAADNGAKIVNSSWGSTSYQPFVDAVDYFINGGGLIVHAAGNDGLNDPDYLGGRENVLTVAAVDSNDQRSIWPSGQSSNWGPWVDVSAAGSDIISLYHSHDDPEGDYVAVTGGTSMASPICAGLSALVWSQNPSWTRQQVFDRIVSTTEDIDKYNPGYEGMLGSGRINTYNALYSVLDTIPPADVTDLAVSTGSGNGEVDLAWTAPGDDDNTGQASTYDIRYVPYANGPIDTETEWNGATQVMGEPTPGTAGTPESFTVSGLTSGASYYFALKTADEVPNWSGLSNSPWAEAGEVPEVKDYALNDIFGKGTVTGDYQDTWTSDNVYESIREIKQGPRSVLEHKWTFDVTGGTTVNFKVEAYHTANTENDHFDFSYSTDDVTYNYLLTVTKTSDDNTLQSAPLSSSVTGTVYIKVVDTDRTKGNTNLETVYIDEMFIESSTVPDTIPPQVTVTSPNGGESWYAGTVHTITWNASDNIGITSTDIDYTYDGGSNWYDVAGLSGNPGSYDWTIPGTFSNLCLVRVTCFDAASNSGSDVSDNYFTILESVEQPMFAESIGMRLKSAGPNVNAFASPKVVEDATGNPPLDGVTVFGHWYGATSDVDQCITGIDGTCEVSSDKVKNPSQQFCFQIDSLEKTNYYWDDTKGVSENCISPTGKLAAAGVPSEFSISQNYPNPFNPTTEFSLNLPAETRISVEIYNIAGQKVNTLVNEVLPAGYHTITWNGINNKGDAVSSGIYFYRVIAGDNLVVKKMIMMK